MVDLDYICHVKEEQSTISITYFAIESNLSIINFSFSILNILGENILQGKLNNVKTILNLSSQPKGIYFIKIEASGSTITKKIIIQ